MKTLTKTASILALLNHVPGCSSYNSVSEKNRVFFNSAAEAEQAGFRKAKRCS
jgi:methylphosphotriester-DNA--protein-cysteine methyltransferase